MIEIIFHLVVLWQTQQVTVLHVHQIVRLHITRLKQITNTQMLTVAFLMFISLTSRFILIDDHHILEAWLL